MNEMSTIPEGLAGFCAPALRETRSGQVEVIEALSARKVALKMFPNAPKKVTIRKLPNGEEVESHRVDPTFFKDDPKAKIALKTTLDNLHAVVSKVNALKLHEIIQGGGVVTKTRFNGKKLLATVELPKVRKAAEGLTDAEILAIAAKRGLKLPVKVVSA